MTDVRILLAAALTIPLWSMCSVIPALAQPAGSTFKDCADCPEMVVIPPGSFMMGSKANPSINFEAPASEQPQHQVQIKSFALGKYEVTQAQWTAVMGSSPSFNSGPTLPVEAVSWGDVQAFIGKLNAKTGKQYRLPTEAEWEYAARAGSTTLFSFGDDVSQADAYAWFDKNADGKTHPVGEKKPNNFGIYDMHGGVWEWVQDCYRGDYVGAPTDGAATTSVVNCGRVIRGGSWVGGPESLRSALRAWLFPVVRYNYLGFRLARSVP